MSKKKVNPRKKPVSYADVEKAKKKITAEALMTVEAIVFTVLMDKFGMEDHIREIWEEVNKLSDEVAEGRVSLWDLREVLEEEYQISLTGVLP